MKAIIMAGGEGTRLRPLTCTMPKPMARILNRPTMEHIILLLKRHGITEIGVTLMYMPEKIRDYFGDGSAWGVSLTYFLEETPLGTAGSVKNTGDFLEDDFLVISGDAITDADLSAFIAFHREKGAEASLLLKEMDIPLEYGVVVTKEDGRICRFLEKPGWSQVCSDTVNTGIYLLNPRVLQLADKLPCDFSKDIFPRLLEEERALYGYVSPDYWCDIGDLDAYRHCHYDLFAGKIHADFGACRLSEGVYAEEGAVIEPGAHLLPPVFIGKNARIRSGARVEGYSVIGEGTVIESGASIKRSVLYDHVTVGKNAQIRGSILLSRAYAGENTALFEQSVLGEESRLGRDSVVKPGVKIWPFKAIGNGEIISSNLVWGTARASDLFDRRGLSGRVGADLHPAAAQKLGGAAGAILGNRIGIAADGSPESIMLKLAAQSGLLSAGCEVFDFGNQPLPITRSGVKVYGLSGAIQASAHDGRGRLEVLGKGGVNPDENTERKLETAFFREEFPHDAPILPVQDIYEYKLYYLKQVLRKAEKNLHYRIAAASGADWGRSLLSSVTSRLGCSLLLENNNISMSDEAALRTFAESVPARDCTLGAVLDPACERAIFIDERGRRISHDLYKALVALIVMRTRKNARIYADVSAPSVIDTMAGRYGATVIRTRESPAAFMAGLSSGEEDRELQFLLHFDAVGATSYILSFLHREKTTLSALVDEIPSFSMVRREITCHGKDKGRIIRSLSAHSPDADMTDGVKIHEKNGWVLILPDAKSPACRIIAHADREEYAAELSDIYDTKIQDILRDAE